MKTLFESFWYLKFHYSWKLWQLCWASLALLSLIFIAIFIITEIALVARQANRITTRLLKNVIRSCGGFAVYASLQLSLTYLEPAVENRFRLFLRLLFPILSLKSVSSVTDELFLCISLRKIKSTHFYFHSLKVLFDGI